MLACPSHRRLLSPRLWAESQGHGWRSHRLAQDGFAGANNPAASAFAGNRFEIGGDIFMPDREMSRTGTGGMLDVSVRSDKRAFLVPEVGYNQSLSDTLSFGVTAYGNGGMNTTYPGGQLNCGYGPANALCGQGKLGVDLMQLVVAPTLAYKLHERHSVGVSPLLVFQMVQGLRVWKAFRRCRWTPASSRAVATTPARAWVCVWATWGSCLTL